MISYKYVVLVCCFFSLSISGDKSPEKKLSFNFNTLKNAFLKKKDSSFKITVPSHDIKKKYFNMKGRAENKFNNFFNYFEKFLFEKDYTITTVEFDRHNIDPNEAFFDKRVMIKMKKCLIGGGEPSVSFEPRQVNYIGIQQPTVYIKCKKDGSGPSGNDGSRMPNNKIPALNF